MPGRCSERFADEGDAEGAVFLDRGQARAAAHLQGPGWRPAALCAGAVLPARGQATAHRLPAQAHCPGLRSAFLLSIAVIFFGWPSFFSALVSNHDSSSVFFLAFAPRQLIFVKIP